MAKRKNGSSSSGRRSTARGRAERRTNDMRAKIAKAFDLLSDPSLSVKQVAKSVALPLDTVNSLAYRGAYKEYRPQNWSLPERRPLVRQVKIGRKLYQSIAAAARHQGMSTKGVVHRLMSNSFPDWRFLRGGRSSARD